MIRSLAIVHYFVQNGLTFGKNKNKFAVTPRSPRIYCYFGGFKSFLSNIKMIMIGDLRLLFHIFKVT